MAEDKIGNLDPASGGRLLLKIWEDRLTGRLEIHSPEGRQPFHFISGRAVITPDNLPSSRFGPYLVQEGAADGQAVKNAAKSRPEAFLKQLLRQENISAQRIWDGAESYILREIKILFSPPTGRFTFRQGKEAPHEQRLFYLSTPRLILEGNRMMSEAEQAVTSGLLEEDIVHLRSAPAMPEMTAGLTQMEAYVMGLVDGKASAAELKERSLLKNRDTGNILLLLHNLGLIETHKPPAGGQMGRLTPSDIKSLLDSLNRKSMAVFKYVSKEIGPVAQTVIDKHIQDAKIHISPLFQPVRLLNEGSLDIQPLLKKQALLTNKETQAELLRGLNEILAAEILAVRKTLGSEAVGPLIDILNKLP